MLKNELKCIKRKRTIKEKKSNNYSPSQKFKGTFLLFFKALVTYCLLVRLVPRLCDTVAMKHVVRIINIVTDSVRVEPRSES